MSLFWRGGDQTQSLERELISWGWAMAKVSRFEAPSVAVAWVGADAPQLKWHFELEVFLLSPGSKTRDSVQVWWEWAVWEGVHTGLVPNATGKVARGKRDPWSLKTGCELKCARPKERIAAVFKNFSLKGEKEFLSLLWFNISKISPGMKIWGEINNQTLCGANFIFKVSWVAD